MPFERVVYALSIPNVGETTAKRLAMAVKSMERLRAMSEAELTAVPDIGPVIARCICDYLRDPIAVDNIDRLAAAGVRMELSADKMAPMGNALDGMTLVFSGTFARHSRDDYKELIEN